MTFSRDGKTAETGTMNLTNLTPENIRKDVNIAGIVGTHNGSIARVKTVEVTVNPEIYNNYGSFYIPKNKFISVATLPANTIGFKIKHGTLRFDNISNYSGDKHTIVMRIQNQHTGMSINAKWLEALTPEVNGKNLYIQEVMFMPHITTKAYYEPKPFTPELTTWSGDFLEVIKNSITMCWGNTFSGTANASLSGGFPVYNNKVTLECYVLEMN